VGARVDGASRAGPQRPELKGYDSTVHLDLTGQGGGDFTLRVAEGACGCAGRAAARERGSNHEAATLLDLLAGRADIAGAQLTGKVASRDRDTPRW